MPDITLRAYAKEIDDLIEHDQLDEAIAHCRHILQTYPKHLNTYRSLGKSYLEAKRYGDAADIFQRVLSAIPDDFVSHIGMSIVREDEGNIDAAIWHMERAFETNPANPAIQQELRRLIGRRDGLEPHKVRLTRGALARMYAQGELYPQAIAELQSALAEDGNRPDLEVLLAKMYWNTEQLAEAAEAAGRVLEALPFCFEANRVTAGALQSTGKSDDARTYLRRLVALDPYMAFVEHAMSDQLAVDPASVRLAKLDWVPGQPMPSTELRSTEWSETLGVESEPAPAVPTDSDDTPAWMAELEQQSQPTPTPAPESAAPPTAGPSISPDSQPFSSDVPVDENAIPEWMREAGWTESDGEVPEGPVSFSDQELDALEKGKVATPPSSDTGDLAPAEIPSWLQDIAPEDEEPTPPEPTAAEEPAPAGEAPERDPQAPGWLDDIAADAAEVTPEPSASQAPPPPSEEISEAEPGDIPTWLEDSSPGATETIVTWLGDRPAEEAAEEAPAAEPAEPDDQTELPSWMSGTEAEETAVEEQGVDEKPSWLDGVAQAAAEPDIAPQIIPPAEEDAAEVELPETTAEAEAPDWLQAIADGGQPEAIDEEAGEESDDWLSGLRAQDEEGEPPSEQVEDIEDEVPSVDESAEWLSRIEPSTPEAEPPESEEDIPDEEDWLARLTQPEEVQPTKGEPDWLTEEKETSAASLAAQEPDWLSGIGEPESETEKPREAESLDWLDGLGGSDSVAEPESETDLNWLDNIDEAGELVQPEEHVVETAPEAGGLDWLEPPKPSELPPQPVPKEEMEWLQQLGEPGEEEQAFTPPPETVTPPPSEVSEPLDLSEADDGDVMEWLETLADQQDDSEEPLPTSPPVVASPEAEPVSPSAAPIPETPEEGLDWLEELADTRGLSDSIEIQPPAGQAVEESSAGWLEDLAEPESEEVHPAPAEAAPPAEATPVAPPPASPTPTEPVPEETLPTEHEPERPVEYEPQVIEPQLESPPVAIPPTPELNVVDDEPVMETPPQSVTPITVPEPESAPVEAETAATPPLQKTVEPEPEPIPVEPPPAISQPEPAAPPASDVDRKPEAPKEDPFATAGMMLSTGDTAGAINVFAKLIKRGKDLETVVSMLEDALQSRENQPELWQTLGDAFMKAGEVDKAVQAYQRGMEVA